MQIGLLIGLQDLVDKAAVIADNAQDAAHDSPHVAAVECHLTCALAESKVEIALFVKR